MYDVNEYLRKRDVVEKSIKRNIYHCRVLSHKQKADLDRQIGYMKERYPKCELITNVASGLNYKRPGLKKILDYGIRGEIETLTIAYKDRLARIGYEMIEYIIEEYSKER